VLLEAGAGTFPLALERQLVGQHRGATLSLRVPYPPDYPNASLAGKSVDFEVEVKDLRVKELPALDDDFARDHGKSESLAELRARVRADLEREAEAHADAAVREQIVEQLVVRHPFDVPSTLVDRRTETLLAGLDVRLADGAERARSIKFAPSCCSMPSRSAKRSWFPTTTSRRRSTRSRAASIRCPSACARSTIVR